VADPQGPVVSAPVGPYSPVVRAGDWLVTSGQLGVVPGADGAPTLVDGGLVAQLRQALRNLASVLAGEGASLADVTKATVFVTSLEEAAAINAVWTQEFDGHRPARSMIGVAALPLGAAAEVEAWVYRPER
jgi:2-iminobutanoate/2-iminopropanoate deaminase